MRFLTEGEFLAITLSYEVNARLQNLGENKSVSSITRIKSEPKDFYNVRYKTGTEANETQKDIDIVQGYEQQINEIINNLD